jgi:hypothetical protein
MIAREANLRAITEETGGHAIVNTNALEAGLARVAGDGRVYYLLTYPSPAPADGRFHGIRVTVKRPGVRVRARSGYWAFSASEMRRAMTPKPDTDAAVLEALSSNAVLPARVRPIHTWIGTERQGARTRVTLAWEPLAASPGERREPPSRVSIVVRTSERAVLFEGSSPGSQTITPDRSSRAGGPYQLAFEAASGVVDVQMVMEWPDGVTETETRTVDVPDYAAIQGPAISTPRVFRARTEPERRALLADAAAVPSATREFARSDRVIVQFDVYGAEASPAAALLNRLGETMHDIEVSGVGGRHQLELRLNHLGGR